MILFRWNFAPIQDLGDTAFSHIQLVAFHQSQLDFLLNKASQYSSFISRDLDELQDICIETIEQNLSIETAGLLFARTKAAGPPACEPITSLCMQFVSLILSVENAGLLLTSAVAAGPACEPIKSLCMS